MIERTILFCKGERIERADLQLAADPAPAPAARPDADARGRRRSRWRRSSDDADGDAAGEISGSLKDVVRAETARVERELIVKALDETGGNVTQAARLLKISRKSLQMKMKEFGLRDREA